jgi:uncharacterized protein
MRPSEIRPLGVGILYNPALPEYLRAHLESVDYISLIPDTFWSDGGRGSSRRFQDIARYTEFLDWLVPRRPVVVHGLGMSIGSAELFDLEHLDQLCRWRERYPFLWHSEHLSFARIATPDGGEHNAGMALPVPYDADVLEMIGHRVEQVRQKIAAPFLLENNVYYANIPAQEMTETQFLNRLCDTYDCGLLLDLHNVHTNAMNHHFDPFSFLRELDLSTVPEIHIAGGNEIAGVYTDSHAGPCPGRVWELLEFVCGRAPNLLGITFEFHESYYPLLQVKGIAAELEVARQIWDGRKVPCHS